MDILSLALLLSSIATVIYTDGEPNPLIKLGFFTLSSSFFYCLFCVCFFVGKVFT